MSDPLGVINNGQPTIVKVHGTAREDVNGKLGIAIQYNTERGRYIIQLTQNQTTMALKSENIVKASTIETYQGQYQQLMNDPRIKSEITKYYNLIQSKLPPGVKPEYVAGGCVVGFFMVVYFMGFTRFITLFSMVVLLALIVGPDIAAGNNKPEQIMRNFPRNCHRTIENSFPIVRGKINEKIAVGIVIVMLLLSGKTLFASYSTPRRAPVPSQGGGGYSTPYSGGGSTRAAIEEAYKKGFDDASNGDVFGHSLPPPATAAAAASADASSSSSFAEDEIPYDYSVVPPPSTKPASKFGMGQAMSLFYMYRMAMQLGNDPAGVSGFSLERAIANAQIMPVWQMGILGFTFLNLIKPFLF